jgi:signal transduction histidine kinase
MNLLFDSFWRAAAYCLYPRVIALSLLPLAIMVAVSGVLGYFYWDPAVAAVAAWLDSSTLWSLLSGWLARLGVGDVRAGLAPLLLVLGLTPLVVVFALLLVALLLAPAVLRLVAERRFPALERRGPDSVLGSLAWSLGHTVLALLALVLSLPLWLVPPGPGAHPIEGVEARRFAGADDPELRAAWDAHLASGGEIVVCGSHALVGRLRAQVLGEAVDRAELSDPVRRG